MGFNYNCLFGEGGISNVEGEESLCVLFLYYAQHRPGCCPLDALPFS